VSPASRLDEVTCCVTPCLGVAPLCRRATGNSQPGRTSREARARPPQSLRQDATTAARRDSRRRAPSKRTRRPAAAAIITGSPGRSARRGACGRRGARTSRCAASPGTAAARWNSSQLRDGQLRLQPPLTARW
jgi:hypothetical protein